MRFYKYNQLIIFYYLFMIKFRIFFFFINYVLNLYFKNIFIFSGDNIRIIYFGNTGTFNDLVRKIMTYTALLIFPYHLFSNKDRSYRRNKKISKFATLY